MKTNPSNCDTEVVELLRVMQKGVNKYGVRKVTDKIKEIDIENNNENYQEVRDFVIEHTCTLMKVDKDEVINKNKRGIVTTARKVIVAVIKEHVKISDEDLARFFRGRKRQVVYNIMREYEQMDRKNKTDQKNFYCYFDVVNARTQEYIDSMK